MKKEKRIRHADSASMREYQMADVDMFGDSRLILRESTQAQLCR